MARKSTKLVVQSAIKKQFKQTIDLPGEVYTNEVVRTRFVELLKKSTFFKNQYLKDIQFLVDNQLIVPVNIRSLTLLEKIKSAFGMATGFEYTKYSLAFFSSYYGRIFILLDNVEKRAFSPNDVAKLVLHEIQHMIAHKYPKQFFSNQSKLFVDFYTYFFENILDIDEGSKIDKAQLSKALEFCITNIEGPSRKLTTNTIIAYLLMIYAAFKNNKFTEEQNERLHNSIKGLFAIIISVLRGTYYDRAVQIDGNERFIYVMLKKAYDHVKISSNKSFVGQEVIYLSELISIACETQPNSHHYQLISKI